MAKLAETSAAPTPARQKRWPAKTWAIVLAIMLPVLAGGGWMVVAAERQTKDDPALAALATA